MSLTITTIFVGDFWQRIIVAINVHLGVNHGMASLQVSDRPLATTPTALGAAVLMLLVAVVGKPWILRRHSGLAR